MTLVCVVLLFFLAFVFLLEPMKTELELFETFFEKIFIEKAQEGWKIQQVHLLHHKEAEVG